MNILVLCTFPVLKASHGGQVRVLNLMEMFAQTGAKVALVGVLGSDHYEKHDDFVDYPGADAIAPFVENTFLMEDWCIGQLFSQSDDYYERLAAKISSVPDLIHVEHPWLFAFAKRYCTENNLTATKIIYGSANIESDLKHKILKNYFSPKYAKACSELILQCELEAIKEADAVLCVSQNDLEFCQTHTTKPLILVQNGVSATKAGFSDIVESHKITGNVKFALYCASGHPPNITGFYDMFTHGLTFLPPDQRLVVAGSAGKAILSDKRAANSPRLGSATIDAGVVSDEALRGLIHNAHVVILPITQGGGTNLKTAEALWSGAHVVATSVAMRGYEKFINTEGVVVTDDPVQFTQAMTDALKRPRLSLKPAAMNKRRIVLWENTLKDYHDYIKGLI